MRTFRTSLLTVLACVAVGLSMALPADDEKKAKDAASLDDEKQEVTTTKDGKKETKKIELKYYLQVAGHFSKEGFTMEMIGAGGPAQQLDDGSGNIAMLEVGDIIVEVDGKKVSSPEDYAKAINGVSNAEKVKLNVKDKNTGMNITCYASAKKR